MRVNPENQKQIQADFERIACGFFVTLSEC